jgi:uncharacterized protein (DUF4415 family)
MADDRIRRPMDSRQAAEAAFKKAPTKPLEPVARQPSIPNAKELVSLRIDRDVLEYFHCGYTTQSFHTAWAIKRHCRDVGDLFD